MPNFDEIKTIEVDEIVKQKQSIPMGFPYPFNMGGECKAFYISGAPMGKRGDTFRDSMRRLEDLTEKFRLGDFAIDDKSKSEAEIKRELEQKIRDEFYVCLKECLLLQYPEDIINIYIEPIMDYLTNKETSEIYLIWMGSFPRYEIKPKKK